MPDQLSWIETGEEPKNLEEGLLDAQLFAVRVTDNHFVDIIHFLTKRMAPNGYTSQQKKELVVFSVDFSVISGHLYKMGTYEILWRYVPKFECTSILAEARGGVVGGHYGRKETTQKILRTGLWWLTLHKDSKTYFKACDACRRTGKPSRRDELPLNPPVLL